ncbi:MAG: helix-turn-helix domain-containing protein [Nostoc sp. DedQUE08]|uniref:helix-turn-helix domain-containing protein n=1 Tax=unclassified Nostoc TaxID=2593658 RepID=UPI002AD34BAD|nr:MULTISPECIES: helix-turn-helix domain-containing protein [unclassified Nostoc]MDZ8067166.1 helix-turn-helix domain-containing protein [Nostoc sp. DedQUE08]MDZ8095264.1 helix-turn-helix domain-containing protein [Nostoc sp. DedQUE05]
MPYTIPNNSCVGCDNCRPQCPTGAIRIEDNEYWVDPGLCNNCEGFYSEPQCVIACPTKSPIPWQAKKGRCKVEPRDSTSLDLFSNGKNNPFASAIAIWEACNVLAQRTSLHWETDEEGYISYSRQVNQGRGAIAFHIQDPLKVNDKATDIAAIEGLDIRAACIHLIFAAYATALDQPWEQEFAIDERQIEKYLGMEKRKDLSKAAKLALMKNLVQQACSLTISIDWPQQGRINGFSLVGSRLWHLVDIQHHFQEDNLGCKYLIGLTFKVKAGLWAQYFLNKQACKERTAFYQYGSLPKTLLTTVMSIWQQHEGAVRLMLWLLFKTKMGKEQRITIPTLLRIAYGEEKVALASRQREERKRLLRTFESDLEILNHYGMKPLFDPVTYPPEIQPLWAKLIDLPEDPDEALEFWTNDGGAETRLTDTGPRGKWNLLMNARILAFELPPEWEQQISESEKKKTRTAKAKKKPKATNDLLGEQILQARKNLNLSQRELAKLTGKSQSWIRDIENGRLKAKLEDQILLRKVLNMASS